MGTEVFGIGSCQKADNAGETVIAEGMDLSHCKVLSDEHADDDGNLPFYRIIGGVTKTKIIKSEQECEDAYQQKCWRLVSVPFVYVEGELADDQGHPDAQSAASLLRFCASRPHVPLNIGLSVEGGTIERGGQDNKTLLRTLATGFALTIKPANPSCSLFLKHDLAKSDRNMKPPARYFEALKKSQAKHSIIENPQQMLLYTLEKLNKSLEDYAGGFTNVKCYNCGHGHRFFKSGDVPNGCPKCGNYFSVSEIWRALNK
jgi:ribosomal protein S27E